MQTTLLSLLSLSNFSGYTSKFLNLLTQFLESNHISTSSLTSFMERASTSYSLILTVVALVFAILGCFMGYKLSKMFMALSGFMIGSIIGVIIAVKFLEASNGIIILAALIGGIIFALFSYKIYQLGIFILCFILGFIVGANLIPLTGDIQFFLCTVCGFVVATLALKSVRPAIIICSAIVCAHSAAKSIILLAPLTGITFLKQPYANFVVFLALCLSGILVQFLTTSEPGRKTKKRKQKNTQ